MTDLRTTLVGGLSGLAALAGQLFPKYKPLADAVAALALVLLGYLAADK